jgi:hypothetical protein
MAGVSSSSFETGCDLQSQTPVGGRKEDKKALTVEDLAQFVFVNEEDALTAFIRAMALLNALPATPSILRSKTFLFVARSALWLASKSHADHNGETTHPSSSAVKGE